MSDSPTNTTGTFKSLDDPWIEKWRLLEAFARSGAPESEVIAYARELGESLRKELWHPQGYAQQAVALEQVVREIETGV